ncbi:AraC family transcriptional regulator with amidase-like domain [Pseudonocardia hierapolitana]|uniref:AraC family transcriptional regulator with amidase-like domain n=2 Tax=Pseudonocardia hierapolitana TaxID=1128676 RepID=A0A561SZI4_9PSEU|nr:AraC family transcriptional regulator with amidase-like domain [Pseudonocardia hierapolitana]
MGSAPTADPRVVVIVAFPGVLGLDVVGPLEVFAMANRFGARPAYATSVVSMTGGMLTASSGLVIGTEPAGTIAGPVDTLMVAGGYSTRQAADDLDLVRWLAGTALSARRVTSVCSGALLLARAGLLDGRRATTHWSVCDTLASHFPSVRVETSRVYVRDGDVWTSGGVTAGIDLALALVENDHGPALAMAAAREMVVFVHRPSEFPQISAQLAVRRPLREPLRDLLALIAEHPDADLSVPALAHRCAMSVRTFSRVFHRETGTTPAAFVQASRLQTAQRLIKASEATFEDIARTCGFGTVETMYRTFQRVLGTTPGQLRGQPRGGSEPVIERRRNP